MTNPAVGGVQPAAEGEAEGGGGCADLQGAGRLPPRAQLQAGLAS